MEGVDYGRVLRGLDMQIVESQDLSNTYTQLLDEGGDDSANSKAMAMSSHRKKFVPTPVLSGVPQGSVLGPYCFWFI